MVFDGISIFPSNHIYLTLYIETVSSKIDEQFLTLPFSLPLDPQTLVREFGHRIQLSKKEEKRDQLLMTASWVMIKIKGRGGYTDPF